MEIFEIIQKECCDISIKSKKKDEAISEISEILKRSEKLKDFDLDKLKKGILDREKLGSTGFGDGIAIPHCKFKDIKDFVVGIAVSSKGVDFESLDNKKVNLFFFVVGPEDQPNVHLQILAQISRIIKDKKVRNELIASPTKVALYENFLRHSRSEKIQKKKGVKQKLMMIVLFEEGFLDDILEYFVELGIRGANVLESSGMGKTLSTVPLFADFINFLGGQESFSKTIMITIFEDEVDDIVRGVENITGDLDKHSGAMIMVLDLFFIKGTMEA